LAVVGFPVTHSKSPALHCAAYAGLNLNWTYEAHDVAAGHLSSFVSSLSDSWRGLSVTMPLKQEAFDLSASHDAHALYTGAVNTLSFSYAAGQRIIRGYNTDVFGITSALRARGSFSVEHAVLIGGGATALSALVALSDLGFESTTVLMRDTQKAADLIALADRLGMPLKVLTLDEMSSSKFADVAICTTPGTALIDLTPLPRPQGAILLDVAYDVWPSPRSAEWDMRGGHSVSGLSMLAYQALKQVRIFTSDAADTPLINEFEISQLMFESIGLDRNGL
jgi:shikimate dehydrogenase